MNRQEQILTMHAAFINEVAQCLLKADRQADFEQLMMAAEANGWHDLVTTIRRIKSGRRDLELLNALDEEDRIIIESILRGLQDPASLPDPNARPDPALAAPGLASMIHAASSGNAQALQIIADMAEQMSQVGGPLAKLAAIIRPLLNGERNPDTLCKKMDSRTEQMVLSILRELEQLEQS